MMRGSVWMVALLCTTGPACGEEANSSPDASPDSTAGSPDGADAKPEVDAKEAAASQDASDAAVDAPADASAWDAGCLRDGWAEAGECCATQADCKTPFMGGELCCLTHVCTVCAIKH